ncbi:MAG: hypothetical protein HYV26_14605, partial [Candidatus Hydrogenedentes bacterium]|nr:hypothetical protein [Candidatus Hydrogenedentota bacterium]
HAGTSSSVLTWDHDHLGDWRAFWSAFQMEGVIAGAALRGQAKKSGAVCSSFRLAPGEEFNVDFVLTWYCPRFKIAGRHLGNAYCNRYKNALEVAQEALKNIDYYSSSVDGWQKRLLLSSLPRWLSFGLMNSCHVFSTNTLYTREGQFALIDSPGDPRTARMDTRLQNSLATLLFFPRLEAAALQQATGLLLPGDEAVWIQHLGELCFHRPEAAPVTQATAICVNLVLSAYRNVMFTGSLARVQEVYPRLRKLIVAVLSQDTNGDALPNPLETQDSEGHSVPGLSSELAGLWVCSLRAMGELASQLRNASDVAWFQQAFDKAQASFERSFWNEEQGWYNHFVPAVSGADSALATACHVGQLAGQQYAGFLGLGDLFNPLHVQRALASMEQYLARPYGVVQWRGPEKGADEGAAPHAAGKREHECLLADAVVNFDSLQIHQGRPESGYGTLEKHFTHLRQGHDLRFDVPCVVNMVNAEETGALDRHASLLALWYVFFAIQGFRYHAPREQIVFTPRLPKNTHMLSVPLFTSFALGWLRFEERPNAPYALRVRFLFDSPIMVRSLVFRLPDFVRQVQVSCELSTGEMKVTHEVTRGRGETRLCIQTSRSVSITGVLYVDVWEAAHAGARSPRKARS